MELRPASDIGPVTYPLWDKIFTEVQFIWQKISIVTNVLLEFTWRFHSICSSSFTKES